MVVGGLRGGILTPQQKVNKFVPNDWSSESWDKGSPAETGSKGVTGSVHSSVPPDILGKTLESGEGQKKFHTLCAIINSSIPVITIVLKLKIAVFQRPPSANFAEEGKQGERKK